MSENIETLQRSSRVIPSPPEVKAHAHIQDYEAALTKPPSPIPRSFGKALPKNYIGFRHGIKFWNGTIPGLSGFLAPPATFPITV